MGWFDQGVLGNRNWSYPGLKKPPSSSGLAAFNKDGELIKHASLKSIVDCYALNVFNNEAWSCTHGDFPIWQIKDSKEKLWKTNLSGTRALAISYPYVLAVGGYGENINCMSLIELTKNAAEEKMKWKIDLFSAETEVLLLDGRANILHLVADKKWHRWDVAKF